MTNPATINQTIANADVTTADEITLAVLEFSGGTFKLITLATQRVEIDGKNYQGETTRCEASAPLEQAIANAPAMFIGEPDEAEWTPEAARKTFERLGRYLSQFHTVQLAQMRQPAPGDFPLF